MTVVLVVDDDPDILNLVAKKLELTGYQVVRADNGVDGLRIATETVPDLVFLDISMPGMSGIDVCRAMRENESTKAVPVIMLTARGQEADLERSFAAGADDYMVKPVSLRELVSRASRFAQPDS